MTPETLALQSTPIITFGYIMQVILSLLVVMAFIFIAAKFVLPKMKPNFNGKIIKVLDHVYLEPQVSAYILSVGRSAWLVAISNKQVSKIDKVELDNA